MTPTLTSMPWPRLTAKALSLLFDVIADLPEGIIVMPVFAADKAEALKAA